MLESKQLFGDQLKQIAGARRRIAIDDVWTAFQRIYPALSITTDARASLLKILNDLSKDGLLTFPISKSGWNQDCRPFLPRWVQLSLNKDARGISQREIAWPPELAFAASVSGKIPLEDLIKIKDWLAGGGRKADLVPSKERSVQIFGDEKRLDKLLKTRLFDKTSLLGILRCYALQPKLQWEKGLNVFPAPIIILENSNTYDSFCKWNRQKVRYSACVYGAGTVVLSAYSDLKSIKEQCIANNEVLYFGDLDCRGLSIPVELSQLLNKEGMPAVEPAENWYALLVAKFDSQKLIKRSPGLGYAAYLPWLPKRLQSEVKSIFEAGYRVPQELVGTELLKTFVQDLC